MDLVDVLVLVAVLVGAAVNVEMKEFCAVIVCAEVRVDVFVLIELIVG